MMPSQSLAINENAKLGCGNEAMWEMLFKVTVRSLMFFFFLFMSLFKQKTHAWAEVCHLSQSSKSVFTGLLSKCMTRAGSLQTLQLYSNLAISHNNHILLLSDFVRMHTREEKMASQRKPSSSVSGSNRLVRLQTWKKGISWCTAQWKMLLFCMKTIVKESRKLELACLN